MSLQNLKRWHWVLISLIVGAVLGNIRHFAMSPDLDTRGSMTQREFEMALARNKAAKESGNRTQAIFSTIVVTRISDPRDRKKPAHKVDVQYWSGSRWDTTRREDGKAEIVTRPKMFIAPIPFHPAGGKADAGSHYKGSTLQRLAETLRLKPKEETGTVIDYLAQVGPASGIEYSYKWHHDRKVQMAGWMSASFVLVGLIWPTLVNLMYFGSLTRPKDETGVSLWNVKNPSASAKTDKPAVSQAEQDKLSALEAELTAKLGGFGANTPRASIPEEDEEAPPPVIKPLSTTPVEEMTAAERERHEFKQKQDDFYPTERRVAKPKE